MTSLPPIYHMAHKADWEAAIAHGAYRGSPDDLRDGFIHCASAEQLRRTALKHRRGQKDLLLIELSPSDLGSALKWETSSADQLFPHIYDSLDPKIARSVTALPLDEQGQHIFPATIP